MTRGQHLHKLFLNLVLVGLVCVGAAGAHAGVRCEDLFLISPTPVETSSRIDSKFLNADVAFRMGEALDTDNREQIRALVEIKDTSSQTREAFDLEMNALQDRGLHVKELDVGLFFLQGNVDVLVSAFRHSAIARISRVDLVGPGKNKWPHFSRVRPDVDPAQWHQRLAAKFEWPDFYRSLRTKVFGPPGLMYQVTIKPRGVLRRSNTFVRFIQDIRNLGLSVDSESPKDDSENLILVGSIDLVVSVLRHPVVDKVIRIDPFFSEQQLLERQQAEFDFREKLKVDYLNLRDIPRGISLVGTKPKGRSLEGFRDAEIPSLIRLEEVKNLRSIIPHEVQTAKDYAKFVRRNFDQDFAFVAEINGNSVPVFDGLVLHRRTQEVLANVSLKYSSERVEEATLKRLTEDVSQRFGEFRRKKNLLTRPEEWFRVVNNLPTDALARAIPEYEANIRNAQTLSSLFGLFTPGDKGARQTRIVIDVRDHGFSFEFFKDPVVQDRLRELFSDRASRYDASLTLIWNDRLAVEIRRDGVKLYE